MAQGVRLPVAGEVSLERVQLSKLNSVSLTWYPNYTDKFIFGLYTTVLLKWDVRKLSVVQSVLPVPSRLACCCLLLLLYTDTCY